MKPFTVVIMTGFLCLLIGLFQTQTVLAQEQSSDSIKDNSEQSANAPQLLTQDYKDWTYRCSIPQNADGKKAEPSCEISQVVNIKQGDKFVEILNFSIAKANDKAGKVKWALIALTPLDVHLPSDFGLQLGKTKPVLTRYRNCNHLGCWVVIPANSKVLNGMKRYVHGFGAFRLLNGQAVKIKFSLLGFSKAFKALQSGDLPEPSKASEGQ